MAEEASEPEQVMTIPSSEDSAMVKMVKTYLSQGSRNYQVQPPREDGSTIISLTLTGHNSSFRTFIDVKVPQDRMLVFVESPVKVPEGEKRTRVAELLMRINYTLALGNFEIDFRDGEVRYRMAIDVEGSALSLQMVETNIMVSAACLDRYFPAIMSVTYGNVEPLKAFEDARSAAASTIESAAPNSSQ